MAERRPGSPVPVFAATGIAAIALVIMELVVMVWVVGQIGWGTLLAILGTSLLGVLVLGLTGKRSMDQFRNAIKSDALDKLDPAGTGLAFTGGALLLIPGFITDVIGLLMVFPLTRPLFRKLAAWYGRQLTSPIVGPSQGPQRDVIRGEVVEEESTTDNDDGPLVIEGTVVDEDDEPRN